jgi:putative membrane protein
MKNETSQLSLGDQLAIQRTALALERTQMASVRTAVSLISFGFTISKFFQQLRAQGMLAGTGHGSRSVGLWLITIGTGFIFFASIQHVISRRALKAPGISFSLILGIVIFLLGLALIISYYTNVLHLNMT